MPHANAFLTPAGRLRLARLVVDDGWTYARAAERFQCSTATVKKWADRLRAGEPMTDRTSRPHRSPCRTPRRLEKRIIGLRVTRRWGEHRISYHLKVPRSTVGRVLARYRMPLLTHLDQATGQVIRKPKPVRYERTRPGDLVHVDIKKLGRIPNGGGHRTLGRAKGNRKTRAGVGYSFLHHAVDDHTRLVYSEILGDERKETAASFWQRARQFFLDAGFDVKEVMTDNGACYRSHAFAAALGEAKHRWTRPYRPQTNGKVERFNRTLAAEWAYADAYVSNDAREATYQDWIHHYNHHRPHTGIDGLTPSARVHNLTGNYS